MSPSEIRNVGSMKKWVCVNYGGQGAKCVNYGGRPKMCKLRR